MRNIVVTGGMGVLGQAVVRRLIADGARIAVLDRVPPSNGSLDASFVLGNIDLSDEAGCADAFARAHAALGKLDSVINVAGGFAWEKMEGGSLDTWDRMYHMNVRTAVASCRAALPYLLESGFGRIVNVGALAAQKAGVGMGAYAAAKSGVARLTESLAEELKDRGITVNAVLPSIIDTPANRTDMPEADVSRWVAPDKLAGVIAFLLSDDASVVTGACLPVGGRM